MLCQLSSSWRKNCGYGDGSGRSRKNTQKRCLRSRSASTKRHPQGADPPGHGILHGTGVSQQSTAAKPAKHSSTARKTAKQHKTYKPYSSAISVFASAFATHENPTHPPKPPTTGQNPQQPVNKKTNNPPKLLVAVLSCQPFVQTRLVAEAPSNTPDNAQCCQRTFKCSP